MLSQENRINSKQELKEWLDYELPFYGSGGLKYVFQLSERAILCKHQKLLRTAEYYHNTQQKIPALLCCARLYKLQNKYALHIPLNTCGKGLRIMHIGPVLLNYRATLGENCKLHINTAVVAGGTSNEAPTLGNSVVLGVGAVVLGNVHVADGVAIGANAVVNKDVTEPEIAVAGVPARKVSDGGSSQWNKTK